MLCAYNINQHGLNWACKWYVFGSEDIAVSSLSCELLMTGFQASLFLTNGTPWNKELLLSKPCDSKHLRQTRRCCSPSPWLTFGTVSPQTSPLSEMAAISGCSRVEGLFWTGEGGKQSQGDNVQGERRVERAARARSGMKSQKVRDN